MTLRFVVLTGGPGGGKTALVEELLHEPVWRRRAAALPEAISPTRGLGVSPAEGAYGRCALTPAPDGCPANGSGGRPAPRPVRWPATAGAVSARQSGSAGVLAGARLGRGVLCLHRHHPPGILRPLRCRYPSGHRGGGRVACLSALPRSAPRRNARGGSASESSPAARLGRASAAPVSTARASTSSAPYLPVDEAVIGVYLFRRCRNFLQYYRHCSVWLISWVRKVS